MNIRAKKRLLRNGMILFACVGMMCLAAGVAKAETNTPVSEVNEASFEEMPEEVHEIHFETENAPEDGYDEFSRSRDFDAEEAYLLAKLAMAEAEGEDTKGEALVIMVVLNRVWSNNFPGTIEEVIMEEHGGVHQFSVTLEGGRWWKVKPDYDCYKAVEMVLSGWDESNGALYFESRGGDSWHQKNLDFLFRHGRHSFYKNRER